jgi:hypothetical protein
VFDNSIFQRVETDDACSRVGQKPVLHSHQQLFERCEFRVDRDSQSHERSRGGINSALAEPHRLTFFVTPCCLLFGMSIKSVYLRVDTNRERDLERKETMKDMVAVVAAAVADWLINLRRLKLRCLVMVGKASPEN